MTDLWNIFKSDHNRLFGLDELIGNLILETDMDMIKFLIAVPDKSQLTDFIEFLKKNSDVELIFAETGEIALTKISDMPVDIVIADETLGDMTGLEFAAKLVSVNPMVNCAVVSPLSKDEFHEASEGLGLVQLPKNPGEKQAADLIQHIKTIKNLTTS